MCALVCKNLQGANIYISLCISFADLEMSHLIYSCNCFFTYCGLVSLWTYHPYLHLSPKNYLEHYRSSLDGSDTEFFYSLHSASLNGNFVAQVLEPLAKADLRTADTDCNPFPERSQWIVYRTLPDVTEKALERE